VVMRWLAQFGKPGDFASLLVLGPVVAVLAIGASRLVDAEMRKLSDKALGAVKSRLLRKRG